MKMTKKFHKCDETCKINHTVPKKTVKKPIVVTENTIVKPIKKKSPVVNSSTEKPKIEAVWRIINIIDEIGNPLETNKVLEKTIITLRKLQQDIAN
jgi:hypothetical protein